jgi:hypothetical protein
MVTQDRVKESSFCVQAGLSNFSVESCYETDGWIFGVLLVGRWDGAGGWGAGG